MSELQLFHTRPDLRLLAAWAGRQGLTKADGDLGYALHALLTVFLGQQAFSSFSYRPGQQGLLGYTSRSQVQVEEAVALCPPDVAAVLGLLSSARDVGYAMRPFPSRWAVGQRLGFEVRVRPVVRQHGHVERDAFLVRVEGEPEGAPVHREAVYSQWLADQLLRHLGAEVEHADMIGFQRTAVLRKRQREAPMEPRRLHRVDGPDATFSGTLHIRDGERFANGLGRGVGRHRSFGFGMLLLRPAAH